MAKVKCKNCGATCCSCSGCKPSTYVNGLCPSCQKKINNVVTTNKGVSELRELEITATTN